MAEGRWVRSIGSLYHTRCMSPSPSYLKQNIFFRLDPLASLISCTSWELPNVHYPGPHIYSHPSLHNRMFFFRTVWTRSTALRIQHITANSAQKSAPPVCLICNSHASLYRRDSNRASCRPASHERNRPTYLDLLTSTYLPRPTYLDLLTSTYLPRPYLPRPTYLDPTYLSHKGSTGEQVLLGFMD